MGRCIDCKFGVSADGKWARCLAQKTPIEPLGQFLLVVDNQPVTSKTCPISGTVDAHCNYRSQISGIFIPEQSGASDQIGARPA